MKPNKSYFLLPNTLIDKTDPMHAALSHEASKERKEIGMKTIQVTACYPTALSAFFPPNARPFVQALATSVGIPAGIKGINHQYDNTPDSLFHQGIGNLLQAAPIVPIFTLQQVLAHPVTPTGKILAMTQETFKTQWDKLCKSNPSLPKFVGRLPVAATTTRIAAQLYATSVGVDAKNKYYEKLGTPVKIYDNEKDAGFNMGDVFKALINERDFYEVAMLTLLVYSPQGRALIQKALKKHNPLKSELYVAVQTEVAGSSIIAALQFGIGQHGAMNRARKIKEEQAELATEN